MVPCIARHHPHPHRKHGSQDHHPSKNSVQKIVCCNSTSNAPDNGLMYPKHVELRIYQSNYLVASSWHFALFREEDARLNNPQGTSISLYFRYVIKWDHRVKTFKIRMNEISCDVRWCWQIIALVILCLLLFIGVLYYDKLFMGFYGGKMNLYNAAMNVNKYITH